MNDAARPSDNPFNAQRVDALRFMEHEYALAEVADRLKKARYRGALVGPHGCGKTTMLQALGDQLMEHGLTPLPLFTNADTRDWQTSQWRHTIRRARKTDALLIDGYDLLPAWARAWVLLASRHAGAVVVTSHRAVRLPTVARPSTSPYLLDELIHKLAPSVNGDIDTDRLFRETHGNLREALRRAYDLYAQRGVE